MRDPRNARLARVIVRHSTRLEPGEVVLIEAFDVADGLVHDIVEEAQRAGAIPLVSLRRNAVIRQMLKHGDERHIALQAEIEMFRMKKVQAYVGLRGAENVSELSDVPPAHTALYTKSASRSTRTSA